MVIHLHDMSRPADDLYRDMFEGALLTASTYEREAILFRLKREISSLDKWMKSLPVVGFSSSNYELCLKYKYLVMAVKGLVHCQELETGDYDGNSDGSATSMGHIYVIKRGNHTVKLRTPLLHFLDTCNYCALPPVTPSACRLIGKTST